MSNRLDADAKVAHDPSWKTPAELKITPEEFAALIAVREALIKGEVRHVKIKSRTLFSGSRIVAEPPTGARMFNMLWEVYSGACGTSYCIGGWVCQTMRPGASKNETYVYVRAGRSEALRPLFYPARENMGKMDALKAAAGIGAFLSGNLDW